MIIDIKKKQVTRYDQINGCGIDEIENGDFVTYEAYEELEEILEYYIARLNTAINILDLETCHVCDGLERININGEDVPCFRCIAKKELKAGVLFISES